MKPGEARERAAECYDNLAGWLKDPITAIAEAIQKAYDDGVTAGSQRLSHPDFQNGREVADV